VNNVWNGANSFGVYTSTPTHRDTSHRRTQIPVSLHGHSQDKREKSKDLLLHPPRTARIREKRVELQKFKLRAKKKKLRIPRTTRIREKRAKISFYPRSGPQDVFK
jgi:hypothetical protein